MVLVLVFAMSGGVYAAKHYVITSTKQISPKVIPVLKGKAGASGAAGPRGAPGSQGTAGANGSNGELCEIVIPISTGLLARTPSGARRSYRPSRQFAILV